MTLARRLPHSPRCFHLKTEGEEKKGAKAAVRGLFAQIRNYPFVLKTDVKSYYASISHDLVMESLAAYIHDPLILNLIYQYLKRCAERVGLFYIRFMDDIVLLAPTRAKLCQAVRVVNQTLESPQLEKHPDKTYIGRVEKGFDFLGYHISPQGLEVAAPTLERFLERAILLYEQEPGEPFENSRLGTYVRRWMRWRQAGF